jgi:hypothetical protein
MKGQSHSLQKGEKVWKSVNRGCMAWSTSMHQAVQIAGTEHNSQKLCTVVHKQYGMMHDCAACCARAIEFIATLARLCSCCARPCNIPKAILTFCLFCFNFISILYYSTMECNVFKGQFDLFFGLFVIRISNFKSLGQGIYTCHYLL